MASLGQGVHLDDPRRVAFFPPPNPPVLNGGRSSGLEGREDSFETSAVGPAKVVLTARSNSSATDYFSRGGRWPGSERIGDVTVRFVMLDVPLDPMPDWSRKSSVPLCSSCGCHSVSSIERLCGWCVYIYIYIYMIYIYMIYIYIYMIYIYILIYLFIYLFMFIFIYIRRIYV